MSSEGGILAVIALLIGLIGAVIGLFSSAFGSEIPFFLGATALVVGVVAWRRSAKGRRGMAVAGTLLGALALACGVWGAVTVEAALGFDHASERGRG